MVAHAEGISAKRDFHPGGISVMQVLFQHGANDQGLFGG